VWLVFDLYMKIIKTFAILILPLVLFVLFKRSLIIIFILFFLPYFRINYDGSDRRILCSSVISSSYS